MNTHLSTAPTATTAQSICTKKTNKSKTYIGVRQRRWGKWVSEIREPRTNRRIWLGSFKTAEMAARAHDVACFCLKGDKNLLNFPEKIELLPRPCSSTPKDIQAAAAAAAALIALEEHKVEENKSTEDDIWNEIELPELVPDL